MLPAPSETGSYVSTAELDGLSGSNGDDWTHRAHRSATNTPLEGERTEEMRRIAHMGTVPEDVPFHGQWLARPRAEHSPPRRVNLYISHNTAC